MIAFQLDEQQSKKAAEWMAKFPPASGPIGGAFTFCFTETTIGVVAKIQHASGSDYENW